MLHIAPAEGLSARLKRVPGLEYLTADLNNPHAMIKMDITEIQYPDNFFDTIYCSHVLEHVLDDRKAMGELSRVLKATGWATIIVPPITTEKTFEDPSITDPAERELMFGQHDHVRRYGRDFITRMEEAGFTVTLFNLTDVVEVKSVIRLGLKEEQIFFCQNK